MLQELGALGNRQFQETGEDPVSHLDIDSHAVHTHHHPPERFGKICCHPGASLVAWLVKNPPAVQETQVGPLGWEDSPGEGNGNALQCSSPEKSMDRGAWRATVHEVANEWTRLNGQHVYFPVCVSAVVFAQLKFLEKFLVY